jgi:hypothetical protein
MRIFVVYETGSLTSEQLGDLCADTFFSLARPESQTDEVRFIQDYECNMSKMCKFCDLYDAELVSDGVPVDERTVLVVVGEKYYKTVNDLNLHRLLISLTEKEWQEPKHDTDFDVVANAITFIFTLARICPVVSKVSEERKSIAFIYESTYEDLQNINNIQAEGRRDKFTLVH